MNINLLLGSGGARGLSFIGVLKVLLREGFVIDQVVGVSMGAIVGAAFCSGKPLAEIEEILCGVRGRQFFAPSLSGPALLSNKGLYLLVSKLVPLKTFEELHVPLSVICTDLLSGGKVILKTGELLPVIVGSSIAAAVFNPVFYRGMALVDGAYSNPVPLGEDMSGVNCVVDANRRPDWDLELYPSEQKTAKRRPQAIVRQAIKSVDILIHNLLTAQLKDETAIIIRPSMDDIQFNEFGKAREAVLAGERAAVEMLPKLRLAVEGRSPD